MSTLFLRTLREDPADAEVASHRLLVRAGYIRRAAPGGYTWLPLGWIVYRNVERIVRAEMDRAGFQEVQFPALLGREPYEATGRWTEYGPNLFRLQDRRGNDMLLAPTHEEMFTLLVKDLFSSYRDLPVSLYQIQTKYRDEARPRAGLLRGREFVMKDSYSFDLDDAGLQMSYQRHRAAYIATFDRLELPYVIVSAMSGAMGGSKSEEFLAPLEAGEDTFVRCPSCGFAANVEAVGVAPPAAGTLEGLARAVVVDTPAAPTITALVDLLNARPELSRATLGATPREWDAADTLKNILVMLQHPDGTCEPLAVGIGGDRELDLRRLEAQVSPAVPTVFGDEDFDRYRALIKGYIGPGALGLNSATGIRYLVDPRVVDGSVWVSGADQPGRHTVGLVAGRDFVADGTIEAAEVRDGDQCPSCTGELVLDRGIEIGHIFQLGRKYSEALGLSVTGPDGEPIVVTMGSYGIGVSRAVAAIAESHHDDAGLCWPAEIAPADIHLLIAGKQGGPQHDIAQRLATDLESAGLRVLFDDRADVSVGVKFADAELIGIPTIVVVGRGVTADPAVLEVRDRRTGERRDVVLTDAVAELSAGLR